MRIIGTVKVIFAYGKCGFITTAEGEDYYFSPKSFPSGPKRMKVGELVSFDASMQNGKPMAKNVDDTLQKIVSVMQ